MASQASFRGSATSQASGSFPGMCGNGELANPAFSSVPVLKNRSNATAESTGKAAADGLAFVQTKRRSGLKPGVSKESIPKKPENAASAADLSDLVEPDSTGPRSGPRPRAPGGGSPSDVTVTIALPVLPDTVSVNVRIG